MANYLVLVLFGIRWILRTALQMANPLIDVVVYTLLIFRSQFFKFNNYIPFLIFLILIATFYNTDALHLVLIVFLCFMGVQMNVQKASSINAVIGIFSILFVLFLLHIGILQDESYVDRTEYVTRERHSMGLGYNLFSVLVFSVVLNIYIALYDKLNKYLLALLCVAIAYITYTATHSNTSFIGGCSLALFHLLYGIRWTRNILSRPLILYSFPLLMLSLTFLLAILHVVWPDIGAIIAGRPRLIYAYLSDLTIWNILFGDTRLYEGKTWVDSSHLHLLFEAGISFYIFFYHIYLKAMKGYVLRRRIDKY